MAKSTFGLDKNLACAATYVLGWVSGLVFLLVEKKDKEVRFNAIQSILFFGAITVVGLVPILGLLLIPVLGLIGLAGWVMLLVKAYQGNKFKLPVIGELAEKYSK